jgi:excisionase family DNA binding protein
MNGEDLQGRYLSVVQVATMLNVSRKTIYHMCSIGYLPCFKLGSRVLIDKPELQARLAELKAQSPRHQSAKNSPRKIVD